VTARRGELEAALDMKGAAVAEAAAQWKKEVVWRRGVVCSDRPGGGEVQAVPQGLCARARQHDRW
jgi:nucleoside phosphorylase